MTIPRTCIAAAIGVVALSSQFASAESTDAVGDSSSALPGIKRVPISGTTSPRLSTAFDAGYGLTESQKAEGVHHRVLGTVGIGVVPLKGLELGLLGGLRHDMHPNDGAGTDSGSIGHVSLVTRYGARLGEAFAMGADIRASFPGTEKFGDTLTSPAIDTRALFGWVPTNGARYAGFTGFRLDRTSHAGSNASSYRSGDRLALGLSDFNAILVGAGIIVPVGRMELLGELTGDLLIGGSAPPLRQSPIRIDIGLRHPISRHFQAELLSEFALSARPNITPASPLIPVEPRFGISIGIRYRIWNRSVPQPVAMVDASAQRPAVTSPSTPAVPKPEVVPPQPVVAPATGQLVVTVVDHHGHPLSDAVVEIENEAGKTQLDFQSGSTFAADAVTVGHGQLTVRADLMQDFTQDVEIAEANPRELRVEMIVADLSGKIRGQIRDYDGKRLAAHVSITPGDREVQANADGAFSIDVPPGKYRVNISLGGYQPQQRSVEVSKNGVMVLNVDMRKGR